MWYLDVNSVKADFLILSSPFHIHSISKLAPVLSQKLEKMYLVRPFCSSTEKTSTVTPIFYFMILLRFSQTCELPSIIITITSNEPWNTETHKTDPNPPITNHKPWPFEPVKVKFCFLRGPLRWLTAAKNAIVSWLLNFTIRMFVKRAVIRTAHVQFNSTLECKGKTKALKGIFLVRHWIKNTFKSNSVRYHMHHRKNLSFLSSFGLRTVFVKGS